MELVAPAVEKFQAVADAQPLFVPVLVALLVVALALAAASMVEPKGKKKSKKSAGGGAPFTPGSRRSTRCVAPHLLTRPAAPLPSRARPSPRARGWDGKKLDAERGSSSPFKAHVQSPGAGGRGWRGPGPTLGSPEESGNPAGPGARERPAGSPPPAAAGRGRGGRSKPPRTRTRPRARRNGRARPMRGQGWMLPGMAFVPPAASRCAGRRRPRKTRGARGGGGRGARTPDSNGGSSTTSLLRPPVPRSR